MFFNIKGINVFGSRSSGLNLLISPSSKWSIYSTEAASASQPVAMGAEVTRLCSLPKVVATATPSFPGAYKRHIAADSCGDSNQHDTATLLRLICSVKSETLKCSIIRSLVQYSKSLFGQAPSKWSSKWSTRVKCNCADCNRDANFAKLKYRHNFASGFGVLRKRG